MLLFNCAVAFSSSYWNCVPIDSYSFQVMSVYNCLTRVGVPIFIMLSGYFLLKKKSAFDWKSYIKRPAKLMLSFYVWAAFYALQGLAVELIRTGSATKERLDFTKTELIFGHYHMWFIFLIGGYYLLFPLAQKIAEERKVLTLFMGLWVLFAFVIPCLSAWANLPVLSGYFGGFEMNAVKGYWGYFFLGYYLKHCDWTSWKKYVIYALGALSLGATIYLTISQSAATGTYVETWLSTGSPFVLLTSVAVFVLFLSMRVNPAWKINKLMASISGCSFFIYMFHVFLLEKMNMIGITTTSFNALISVPALSLLAFVISLLLGLFAKKIPFAGKILLYKS